MADHMIKLSEVPKGQKMRYLWDYYKIPALVVVLGVIATVSLVKTIFFTPKADINIMFTTRFELDEENAEFYDSTVFETVEDYNGDGKKLVNTVRLAYDEDTAGADPQYAQAIASKIGAELAAGETIVQICDDSLYKVYEGYECLATYEVFDDFSVDIPHGDDDEIVKIPLSSIKCFEKLKSADGSELYITVRPPMQKWYENEKKNENYSNHLKFIAKLLSDS